MASPTESALRTGSFSLDSCRCVGACGLAPVMMINGRSLRTSHPGRYSWHPCQIQLAYDAGNFLKYPGRSRKFHPGRRIPGDILLVDVQPDLDRLTVIIADDGCGMTEEQVAQVTDPFYTSRTTRKVGLGVPFFKLAAESTGGSFSIESEPGKGTTVTAVFDLKSH